MSFAALLSWSVLIVVPFAVGCGSYRPPSIPFHATASTTQDWHEVLSRPAHVSLQTFETGRVRVHRSDIIDLEDPRARGLSDEEIFAPVFAHLIHHDVFGDYLIDTGLDRSFERTTSGDARGLFAFKMYALQGPGEDIVSRLAAEHVSLQGVFFTHLHPDHVSGATSLPRNIRYIAGTGEDPVSAGFFFFQDALSGVSRLERIDFAGAAAIPPLGPSVDVFGDGSIWAISTPGHSKGHISYLVVTKSGPVLLSGDASHTRWGFEHGVPPGKSSEDAEGARRSLAQLELFAHEFPEVRVVFGHSM